MMSLAESDFNPNTKETTSKEESESKILQFQEYINQNNWKSASGLIQTYFIPNNIDLFPIFHSIRKTLSKNSLIDFERVVSLVPIKSPIIQTFINSNIL
jgi:hypothetical protein